MYNKFGKACINWVFGHILRPSKQVGWCHIQCLNTAVYTKWPHKLTYMIGHHVDFIPHQGNIKGTYPNKTAIRRLAHAHIRESACGQSKSHE